jgi:hypothetical protein
VSREKYERFHRPDPLDRRDGIGPCGFRSHLLRSLIMAMSRSRRSFVLVKQQDLKSSGPSSNPKMAATAARMPIMTDHMIRLGHTKPMAINAAKMSFPDSVASDLDLHRRKEAGHETSAAPRRARLNRA